MRLARVLGGIGRTMITLGVLILLFVAYQLWGTGIREAQAQDRLQHQFDQQLSDASSGGGDDSAVVGDPGSSGSPGSTQGSTPADSTPTVPETATSVAPTMKAPSQGSAVGKIEIPKIGLSAYFVEGVETDDLKNGPGHYPGTPLPGQKGNAAIAGHRSTYGAPFANVDNLQPGDPITVTTLQGTFLYEVTGQEIVSPNDVAVLNPTDDNELTLTACHPKYSASKRIIIHSTLKGVPLPATPTTVAASAGPAAPAALDANASGKQSPKLPAIMFGLLCAGIWFLAWLVAKRWRKWPAYLIGLPFFLVALFYFFENFSRLLPANY